MAHLLLSAFASRGKTAANFAIIFTSREAVCAARGHSSENGKGQVHELSRLERVDRVEGESVGW